MRRHSAPPAPRGMRIVALAAGLAIVVVGASAVPWTISPRDFSAGGDPPARVIGVIATIPTGVCPIGVAVDNVNGLVYVADFSSDNVTVINGATNSVVGAVSIPVYGGSPWGVATDPVNGNIYVSYWAPVFNYTSGEPLPNGSVYVIDPVTERLSGSIAVQAQPGGLAVDSTTGEVFVADNAATNVSVINESSVQVAATIQVGYYPGSPAVDAASGNVYVTTEESVKVIDGATRAVLRSISVPGVQDIAVDVATDALYASTGSNLTTVNLSTGEVDGTFVAGMFLLGIAVDPQTGYLFAADFGRANELGNVSVIDAETNAIVERIPVGINPGYVAFDPRNDFVYVTNCHSNDVTVIDAKIAPPGSVDLLIGVLAGAGVGMGAIATIVVRSRPRGAPHASHANDSNG